MNNKLLYDEMVTFAEKYSIVAEEYENVSVTSLPFSVRVINRFKGAGITTVAALLNSSPNILMGLNGFGKNCLDEVDAFCLKLVDDSSVAAVGEASKRTNIPSIFAKHCNDIAVGDFSVFDEYDLSETDQQLLDQYKEAYAVLGAELVFDCVASFEKVVPLTEMFSRFQKQTQRHVEIWNLAQLLPKRRKHNIALGYIKAFTLDDNERALLQSMCSSESSSILSMANTDKVNEPSTYLLLKRFLNWCTFNLEEEIDELFSKLYSNDRTRTVVQMRAEKQTLEQIGTSLGITRERVRQIEAKAKRLFNKLHSRIRIISKIAAERNGDNILTPAEIEEYCGKNSPELLFFLQSYESANYTYDRQLDIFIVGNDSIRGRVQNYIDNFPEIVKASQLKTILDEAADEADIPAEMLEKAFLDAYRITGEVYHRYSLSLAKIYEQVLETHYPNGFKAYDPDEIRRFRETITNEYGDIGLPENDHALTSRVASICVLCGRGIYCLKKKAYLPKALANKIHEYIIGNDNPIFLTNTLFSVFEEELVAAGINNKYFLQGVLHELFGDEFVFRRDYISKDASFTSVYSAVVDFIKKSDFLVSKSQIQDAFPGITEIVINMSVGDPNVLNYFGSYLHASKLNISDFEKTYLHYVVKNLISDGETHHGKELYDAISYEKPEIFTRNAAMIPFSAYSIIEYLFRDEFQFSRPYVTQNGKEIGRAAERLHDLVYSSDEITVSEISEFIRENYFQIQSLLDYVNSCNDEFVLATNDLMVRISRTGVTEELAAEVDNLIADNISETMPIKDLPVWSRLPKIEMPWTEWLIYSVINKWGKRTLAATSSNQFRLSVPLVAPINNYNPYAFRDIDKEDGASFAVDDLSNMDALLEDLIGDDFLSGL